ncbi:extracellular solute-binding protein [Streptomyces sp. NRRL F-5123]|uniref:extracellular solute-binding protein n=1 Tax=Streptomyces sp. NRRL F-5123 TaxID=1463856 RepID=UPI0004E10C36|nr:extracellular solute-binding protein [Streptomyces sp. NRRL F-5123]
MSTPSFSRRSLLRSIAASGAAVAAPSVLAACSTSGRKHDVGNAGKKLAPWPAYVPFSGPAPDLPGTADGIQPGYLSYPKELATAVHDKPGKGTETIKVMTITYGTPPKPAGENRFWTAVNEALGVKLEFTVVPDSDYMTKMATMMAGNDLPDVINFGGGHTLPREADFVVSKCADLSDYISGDAVKAYPNLANLPTYVWQDMGHIAGRLWGIPVQRSAPGNCLWINNDVFTAAGMKDGWTSEDFLEVAKAATKGRKYGLGSSQPLLFGETMHSMAWGAPQEWKLDGGAFVSAYTTDEYRASIEFMLELRQANLYNPNVLGTSTVDCKTFFYNGTVGSMVDGFGALSTSVPSIKDAFVLDAAVPYTPSNGAKPGMQRAKGAWGYTVLKKTTPDRIKLILRVLDYLASPFGTKEYELNHFGVEGTHFTRDGNGSPLPTELGQVENPVQLPIKYLCDAPQVLYMPGRPDVVQRNHAWQLKVAPMLVRNPRFGLQSQTFSRVGAAIDQLRTDTIGDVVSGRKPMSAWGDAVKKMRNQGLDRIAEDYAKDYASNH